MKIVTAKMDDLQLVRDITRNTINEVYPKYYPAGAVQFFLEHQKKRIRK